MACINIRSNCWMTTISMSRDRGTRKEPETLLVCVKNTKILNFRFDKIVSFPMKIT